MRSPIFYTLVFLGLLSILANGCSGQKTEIIFKNVGGPCEGCEALYEYNDRMLNSTDTLPGFLSLNPKLKISGTVYQMDGRTPAGGIILYIYHTNRSGVYETKAESALWEKRHGIHRGWTMTDKNGKYTFYTFRPAAYPGGSEPEHIHITVKEPGMNPYYLDDFVFTDDPKLANTNHHPANRGGSGVVTPFLDSGMQNVKRDIFLGLNIPGYP